MTTLIDRALLASLTAEAEQAPRLRKNRNFHPGDAYPAHRLLIAIEPGSYVAPHRHLNPDKDETLLVVCGRLGVVIFQAENAVDRSIVLQAGGEVIGIDIPHGVFHTVLALEPGTVFFEAKAGPYVPIAESERAPWAPAEGTPAADDYLKELLAQFA
ncbi:WbuC family cupin fold metalloprotein [Ferribacterium limneticum]|uniref:WbuC family cupin fold metalloprotein n=1 Tax=Ferribacterium limneticum TaxID=76259 RepID=UPI001CFA879C|nr:WbuC family cupin fold metalloprotein [Ferribacterium limneticum]UCV18457.1 WbuC family cupin fold metalloprotein [Ferribacterium limneticum]